MRSRWTAVAATVAVLAGLNLVARLVLRLAGDPVDARDFWVSAASLGAMAVAAGIAGFWWAKRYALPRVVADLLLVLVASALVVVLIGPYLSGGTPFGSGWRIFLLLLAVGFGVPALGAVVGVLTAVALGLDPKSRAYKAYVERAKLRKDQQRPGRAKARPGARPARPPRR